MLRLLHVSAVGAEQSPDVAGEVPRTAWRTSYNSPASAPVCGRVQGLADREAAAEPGPEAG
jgi:hypothetical protein